MNKEEKRTIKKILEMSIQIPKNEDEYLDLLSIIQKNQITLKLTIAYKLQT